MNPAWIEDVRVVPCVRPAGAVPELRPNLNDASTSGRI